MKAFGSTALVVCTVLACAVGCDSDDVLVSEGSSLESLVEMSVLPAVERVSNLVPRLSSTTGAMFGRTFGDCRPCPLDGSICRSEDFGNADPDDPINSPVINFAYDACDEGDEYGSLSGNAANLGSVWTVDLTGPRVSINGRLIVDAVVGNGPLPQGCTRTSLTTLTLELEGLSTATFEGVLSDCFGDPSSLTIAMNDEAFGRFDAEMTFDPPTIQIAQAGEDVGSCVVDLETLEATCP